MDEEYKTKVYLKKFNKNDFDSFVIGSDVGGTNTNICIAGVENKKIKLIFSLHYKTKNINSINPPIKKILKIAKEKYGIRTDIICIAAAGFVEDKKIVNLTNASWDINAEEIKEDNNLKKVYIINDFQAIGYAVNVLDHENKKEIFTIKKLNKKDKKTFSTKSIIGAGTGLGKSILIYDKNFDAYLPIPSEGGHCDFPIQDDFEKKISEYIKKKRNIKQSLTYEELISGRGIEGIYKYLRKIEKYKSTEYTEKIDESDDKAPLISKYKEKDETCKKTFELFVKFYARCAKNLVLETLSTDGLYIAGGIASKNINFFKKNIFTKEFEKAYRRSDVLKKTPIYLILNYNASLYGACFAAVYKKFMRN